MSYDFGSIADGSGSPDERADQICVAMAAAGVAFAAIPGFNAPLFAAMLGAGVVAIGKVYGVTLTGEDGWKLIKQFFLAAGFTFLAAAIGLKVVTALAALTGIGYGGAVALDAVSSSALAFAVGKAGKAYFKGERDKHKLGKAFRDAFNKKKENPDS